METFKYCGGNIESKIRSFLRKLIKKQKEKRKLDRKIKSEEIKNMLHDIQDEGIHQI